MAHAQNGIFFQFHKTIYLTLQSYQHTVCCTWATESAPPGAHSQPHLGYTFCYTCDTQLLHLGHVVHHVQSTHLATSGYTVCCTHEILSHTTNTTTTTTKPKIKQQPKQQKVLYFSIFKCKKKVHSKINCNELLVISMLQSIIYNYHTS